MSITGWHVLNHRTPEECDVLSNTKNDLEDAFSPSGATCV